MYTSAVLLSALAATVSASLQPVRIPYPNKRLEARQTADDSDYTATADTAYPSGTESAACDDAVDIIYSLVADMPSPPDDVASYIATYTATDLCASSLPTSLSADYSSWTSEVIDWYSSTAAAAVSSAIAECPELDDGSDDSTDLGFCTDDGGLAAATGSGVASATATATATGSDDKTTGSSSTATETGKATTTTATKATATEASSSTGTSSVHTAGAVPREVGAVGAAIAGVLAVAIAL